MDMDEALHAIRGLEMASDFRNFEWEELWQDFSKPEWYPPMHGILSGTWLLVFGPSITAVRLYSAFFYMLLGLLLWSSAKELIPNTNPFLYLIPPLFLISDGLHSVHAGMSMLELPAIAFAFAGLLFLNRSLRRKSWIDHLFTLFFGLLCLFTKYNYGLVLFAVFLICHLWIGLEAFQSRRKRQQGDYQILYILSFWLGFGLIAVLWFWGLGQWQWFTAYATAQPENYVLWSWMNLSYYPRRLWGESVTWLAILLSILGIVQSVRKRQFFKSALPYWLFFGINLVLLTWKLQNDHRFSMVLLPSLWITSIIGVYSLVSEISHRWMRNAIYGLLIGGLLAAGVNTFYNFQSALFVEYENTNDGVDQAYQFIADVLDVSHQNNIEIVMLGRSDQWNGQALQFHLEAACMSAGGRCDISVQDTRVLRKGWPEQEYPPDIVSQRLEEALNSADFRVHFFNRREHPVDWTLISEKKFTFERFGKKPETIWVSIYKR